MKNMRAGKRLKFLLQLTVVLSISWYLTACSNPDTATQSKSSEFSGKTEDISVPDGFNYETVKDVSVQLTLLSNNNSPLKNVTLDIYNQDGLLLTKGLSNDAGVCELTLTLPTYLDQLVIKPNYIGLSSEVNVPIQGKNAIATIGGASAIVSSQKTKSLSSVGKTLATKVGDYYTLGTWDKNGVPEYLEPTGDVISQSLLDDINASLPETRPVPTYNPEYLDPTRPDMNTKLGENADVFVTFVHEGAGYKNVLGYYKYDLNNPPKSVAEIDSMFVIFPNVSYLNSGGGLKSGNKVKIGRFPANTGIGWFLIPDGWNPSTLAFNKSSQIKFSVKDFNTFTSATYRQHVILLKDPARQLVLLSFEDQSRPAGDNDFNDAIFYVTANPYSAIITDDVDNIKQAIDTDKDGVYDSQDNYPTDPERAYDQYSPAKDTYGTLAYEDLWPVKGDYDFNDLVVDYNYQLVLNAKQSVVEMFAKFKIKAIGGTYKNGFGFQLNVTPNKISSVAGADLKSNYINIDGNGTESGQQLATIVVFDNAFNHMSPPAGFYTVNAQTGSPSVTPYEVTVKVAFITPIPTAQLGSSPFNPFIIADRRRGYEVHLPGGAPTSLADQTLFGTGDDNTVVGQAKYYKTLKNLPWGVNIPESFKYPSEKSDITKAHLHFKDWVESGGQSYRDWYKNNSGYRNTKYIY